MGTRVLVAVAALALPMAGCGGDDSATVGLTADDTRFVLDVGEEFTIVLESNATTGYGWELSEQPPTNVVTLIEESYVAPDTDLVGAPGRQELTFRAVGDGSTFIQLWYVRPFDDPPDPAGLARYEVIVGTGSPGDQIDPSDIDAPIDEPPSEAIGLAQLVATTPDEEVAVRTLLFDDGSGLVMCEVLAESFPPQCIGGAKVPITNPDVVDADFTQQDEIRWTDRPVVLEGRYRDGTFTVSRS